MKFFSPKTKRILRQGTRPVIEALDARRMLALTHLYTFNDGTANDTAGTAHGTLLNGATITSGWLWLQNSGKLSNDATLQYANLPPNILPATGSTSVEVWYTNSSQASTFTRVFDFGDQVSGAGNSYLFYTPRSSSNDARGVLHPAGSTERVAAKAGGTYDGYSHMASVVVDSSANQLRLYVDGALVTTSSLSGASAASINNLQSFIGRSLFDTDTGFSGAIDELRIYNHALTTTEVGQHYGQGATRPVQTTPARQIEKLNRGVVATRTGNTTAHISWRQLATDPIDIGFNLYRSVNGAAATKVNTNVITATTDYTNTGITATVSNAYYVRAVINGVEQAASETFTLAANTVVQHFLEVPLNIPAGGTTPSGEAYTYSANDTSVGDVDGDGQYELIVKWDPSNAKDNSQSGYTGNVYVDAYRLDGTQLWRIDLGRNIRAGAHYTQFQVYDLDGDGKAEVAIKTAPGTVDGAGNNVLRPGDSATADYRTTGGYILSGPEYLTVFNGLTGAAMATAAYTVPRGSVSSWGDTYGNRVDRFLAGVAYLDGKRPSLIMARGYYTRATVAAWDFRNGVLTQRWQFDSNVSGGAVAGQGAHSLTIGDYDNDGKDEITYGAAAINDNGTMLYSTGLGHGDALHTSDLNPVRPGQETFQVHEDVGSYVKNGVSYGGDLRDASTGQLLFNIPGTTDIGRGISYDIDPRFLGAEMWSTADGNLYNVISGNTGTAKPSFVNFAIQWDADPQYEVLDGTTIGDWRAQSDGSWARTNYDLDPLASSTQGYVPNGASNNGTKSTPALSVDLYGDYREELIVRRSDNTSLMIMVSPIAAVTRMTTLMHDIQYREAIAWQNTAYNQPPHTSFYFGDSMPSVPRPLVYLAGVLDAPTGLTATAVSTTQINLNWTDTNPAESGFDVERSTDGINYTKIITVAADVFTYASTSLSPGTTYYYRVRAVGAGSPSGYSNVASAATLFTPGSISGVVFEDRDGSQTNNAGDTAMIGVTVYLDTNNNSVLDSGEPSTVTTGGGFSITGLTPGNYNLRQILPAGYTRITPASDVQVISIAGTNPTANFGNFPTTFTGTSGADNYFVRSNVNGDRTQVWVNVSPISQPTPNYSIATSLLPSLTFSGQGGNDALILDNSFGDPAPVGGISFEGGADADTFDLRGSGLSDIYALPSTSSITHAAETANFVAETLRLSVGTFNINVDLGPINLDISGSASAAKFLQTQNLATLIVGSGANVTSNSSNNTQPAIVANAVTIDSGTLSIAPDGGIAGVSKFKSLSIANAGKLELHDNDLIIDYTSTANPQTNIRNWVKQGITALGGAGTTGISSAEVNTSTVPGAMLAVVDNASGSPLANLSGYAFVPAQSVLIKFTWIGDANLDGAVDGTDYALLDSGFASGSPSPGWRSGDWNYDDLVDGTDYALIDTGFGSQTIVL